MRHFSALIALIMVLLASCTPNRHDWIVEPGVRVGPITASTSAEDVRKAFGSVTDKEIDIGEGTTELGTDIYETIPAKRLAVLWTDPKTRKNPARVMICYQLLQGDCAWHTSNGISLNTTLKDLERLNGRSFKLLGFGWDYSGTVSSWEGGRLEKTLLLRLGPDEAATTSDEYRTVLGETEYSSSDAAMQKLNPKVYSMELIFRR